MIGWGIRRWRVGDVVEGSVTALSHPGLVPVAASSEHGNEPYDSIKGGICLYEPLLASHEFYLMEMINSHLIKNCGMKEKTGE